MEGIQYLNTLDDETRNSFIIRRVKGIVALIKTATSPQENKTTLMLCLTAIGESDLLLFNPVTINQCAVLMKDKVDVLCKRLLDMSPSIKTKYSKEALFAAMELYGSEIDYLVELADRDVEDWHRAYFLSLVLDTFVLLLHVRNEMLLDLYQSESKNIFTRLKHHRLRSKLQFQ